MRRYSIELSETWFDFGMERSKKYMCKTLKITFDLKDKINNIETK